MNLPYLVPRVIRHFLPEVFTRFLLLRSLIIKPSLETADPELAVRRYTEALATRHRSLTGKRVLVLGYGGRFDIGIGLLEAGAAHVVLCDKYAPPDDRHNAALIADYSQYLHQTGGRPRPQAERITLMQQDVRDFVPSGAFANVDLVFSNSVYEHLDDVDGSTRALAEITQKDGLHIHYVDLRDHFFKYPFEMLHYSEGTWRRWLNPTSNHNRFRLWDYRRIFEKYFEEVELLVLERDAAAFERVRRRLRPEFASGKLEEDSVTLIRIVAAGPRR